MAQQECMGPEMTTTTGLGGGTCRCAWGLHGSAGVHGGSMAQQECMGPERTTPTAAPTGTAS